MMVLMSQTLPFVKWIHAYRIGEEPSLLWWKSNQHHFPQITWIAEKYLCVPAISIPAERVFSTAGLTVTRL